MATKKAPGKRMTLIKLQIKKVIRKTPKKKKVIRKTGFLRRM